jgi:hypothetical protein
MDVGVYLNCSEPELTNARLVRIVNREDTSDLESYVKEVGYKNMRDFIQYLVVNCKIKLLKKLIDIGMNINYELGHGILLMMCFTGGKARLESIMFLLRYKLDVNFKIMYNGVLANFLDLIVYISCSQPIIELLKTNGARVINKEFIPFNLESSNVYYNMYLLREVYSKTASYKNTSAIEFLMKENYRDYAVPISQLGIKAEELSITVRLLILCVISVGCKEARAILISLAGRLPIDTLSLPLSIYRVEFDDVIRLIRTLKVSVLSQVEWNVDCLLEWLFKLPCDPNKLLILRDEGIDFNLVSKKLIVRDDWQLALIQVGLAGNKPKSRIINIKGTSDTIVPQNNTNTYLISEGILKQYREYYKRQSRVRTGRSASLSLKKGEEPSFEEVHRILTPRR